MASRVPSLNLLSSKTVADNHKNPHVGKLYLLHGAEVYAHDRLLDLALQSFPCDLWTVNHMYLISKDNPMGFIKGQDTRYSPNWSNETYSKEKFKDKRIFDLLTTNSPFTQRKFQTRPTAPFNVTREPIFVPDYLTRIKQFKGHICYYSRNLDFIVLSLTDDLLHETHPSYYLHKYHEPRLNTQISQPKPSFEVQAVIYMKDLEILASQDEKRTSIALSGYHFITQIETIPYDDENTVKTTGFSNFDRVKMTHHYAPIRPPRFKNTSLSVNEQNNRPILNLRYDNVKKTFYVDYASSSSMVNALSYEITEQRLNECLMLSKEFPINRNLFINHEDLDLLQRNFSLTNVHYMTLSEQRFDIEADSSWAYLKFKERNRGQTTKLKIFSDLSNVYNNTALKKQLAELIQLEEELQYEYSGLYKVNSRAFENMGDDGYIIHVNPNGKSLLNVISERDSLKTSTSCGMMLDKYFEPYAPSLSFAGAGKSCVHPLLPQDANKENMIYFQLESGNLADSLWEHHPLYSLYKSFENQKVYTYKNDNLGNPNVSDNLIMNALVGFNYDDLKRCNESNEIFYRLPLIIYGACYYFDVISYQQIAIPIPIEDYDFRVKTDDNMIHAFYARTLYNPVEGSKRLTKTEIVTEQRDGKTFRYLTVPIISEVTSQQNNASFHIVFTLDLIDKYLVQKKAFEEAYASEIVKSNKLLDDMFSK